MHASYQFDATHDHGMLDEAPKEEYACTRAIKNFLAKTN